MTPQTTPQAYPEAHDNNGDEANRSLQGATGRYPPSTGDRQTAPVEHIPVGHPGGQPFWLSYTGNPTHLRREEQTSNMEAADQVEKPVLHGNHNAGTAVGATEQTGKWSKTPSMTGTMTQSFL